MHGFSFIELRELLRHPCGARVRCCLSVAGSLIRGTGTSLGVGDGGDDDHINWAWGRCPLPEWGLHDASQPLMLRGLDASRHLQNGTVFHRPSIILCSSSYESLAAADQGPNLMVVPHSKPSCVIPLSSSRGREELLSGGEGLQHADLRY